MTLEEFTASLNEEQLRFLIAHFHTAPVSSTEAEMDHIYHCQRGQLKNAVRDALFDRAFTKFDSR